MAARRSKNADTEKLDSANIEKVIKLLEQEKPITKKDACSILCIAYNTTRLSSIIEKHKEKRAKDKERRGALRGKPATKEETSFIIQEYLEGSTSEAITTKTYRSTNFVYDILQANDVPMRARAHDYFKPQLIPEGAVRNRFEVGEVVYSARYDSIAEVRAEQNQNNQFVYRIWLLAERWQQFAYQEACELASLKHLQDIGVRF